MAQRRDLDAMSPGGLQDGLVLGDVISWPSMVRVFTGMDNLPGSCYVHWPAAIGCQAAWFS